MSRPFMRGDAYRDTNCLECVKTFSGKSFFAGGGVLCPVFGVCLLFQSEAKSRETSFDTQPEDSSVYAQ